MTTADMFANHEGGKWITDAAMAEFKRRALIDWSKFAELFGMPTFAGRIRPATRYWRRRAEWERRRENRRKP